MIKWLFKNLVLPVLIILAIPLVIIAFMYQPLENPLASIEDNEETPLLDRINDSVETFLNDETGEIPVVISMSEDEINGLLKEVLQDQNNQYLLEDDYVIEDDLYGYSGSWVEFKDDTIVVVSKVDVFLPIGEEGFTFQSALNAEFSVDINMDTITLQFESLKIGNLGLLWIYDIANTLIETFSDLNIETIINDVFSGYGTFDAGERSVMIDVKDLLKTALGADEETGTLIEELMTIINAAELIEIGPVDDAFEFNIQLQKLRLETPLTPFDTRLIPQDSDAFSELFESLFDPYILMGSIIESTLNSDAVSPYVDLDETMLNQVTGYILKDTLNEGIIYELTIGTYTVQIQAPIVSVDEVMHIIVPISMSGESQSFETAIFIEVNPTMDGSDVLFELTSITLGTIEIEEAFLTTLLAYINSDFITDNAIRIENIDTLFGIESISIESIAVNGDALRITVNADNALDTSLINQAVGDLLDAFVDDESIPEAVSTAAQQVLDGVSSGDEEAISQAVSDMIDAFDTLTEEEQTELSNTVLSILENSDITFENIFDLIPE